MFYNMPVWKSRYRKRFAFLRKASGRQQVKKEPLRTCHSCNMRLRLGGEGRDGVWYCEMCWRSWLLTYSEPVQSNRCQTCNLFQSYGWYGDEFWHCETCWKGWFNKYSEPSHQGDWCYGCWEDQFVGWWGEHHWYCGRCWDEHFESAASDMGTSCCRSCSNDSIGDHFDFVEIGTSNYNTFTQCCAGSLLASRFASELLPRNKNLRELRGLAVDMKKLYLDQLPDLANVTKLCAAVAEHDGVKTMQHVPVKLIRKWESFAALRGDRKTYNVMQLAQACSSLSKHKILRRELKRIGLSRLIKKKHVDVQSLGSLLQKYGASSVGILALDCEGHDCSILNGFLRACKQNRNLFPRWVALETNGMNDESFGEGFEEKIIGKWVKCGYFICHGGGYRKTRLRDTILRRNW